MSGYAKLTLKSVDIKLATSHQHHKTERFSEQTQLIETLNCKRELKRVSQQLSDEIRNACQLHLGPFIPTQVTLTPFLRRLTPNTERIEQQLRFLN